MHTFPLSTPRRFPRPVGAALTALCLSAAVAAVQAQAPARPRNVYTAGGEVRPSGPVTGDLIAAGGRIVVEQPVGGDAALAGGSVEVRAAVGDDLRVAGGSVSVENRIGGDLFAAGGDVSLRPGTIVAGAADLNAANVLVQGRIEGPLRGRAQKIVVDGEVAGPAQLSAERIELGPKARLRGPLTYASATEISRSEGAVVAGPITHETSPRSDRAPSGRGSPGAPIGAPGFVMAYSALFAVSSAFVLLLPGFTTGAAGRLRHSPWAALGIGAASLIALPVVVLLLFITILGIPLGLALLAAYPVVLLAGFVLGVVGLTTFLRRGSALGGLRLRQLALGLLVVLLLGLVPVAGAIFIWLLGLAGLGAAVLQVRGRHERGRQAAGSDELPLPGHDVFPA